MRGHERRFGRRTGIGVGILIAALTAGEAQAQYGIRGMPLTGVRTGLRYQPSIGSPFLGGGGLGYGAGLSRYGGFYGSRLGVGYPGIGLGYGGLGYRGIGLGSGVGFSLSIGTGLGIGGYPYGFGAGYPGYGLGYGGIGLGYPGYGYGYGYGSPWLYGRYPYGSVGFSTISYGGLYPSFGGLGYGGFPYGYGYGYRGGYYGGFY